MALSGPGEVPSVLPSQPSARPHLSGAIGPGTGCRRRDAPQIRGAEHLAGGGAALPLRPSRCRARPACSNVPL